MKTKQSQQFNHWGQKGLRKIPILPLSFSLQGPGKQFKKTLNFPLKMVIPLPFLVNVYIYLSLNIHIHATKPQIRLNCIFFFAKHTPHSALTEIIERFCLSLLIAQNHIPEKQQELSVHSQCCMFKRARGKRKGEGRGTFETHCPLTLGEFSELSHFSG